MRKKIILLLSIFILFGLIIGARFLFLKTQATDGQLKIIASPNATIYLNNAKVGSTPFDQKVKEGEYVLKLEAVKASTGSAIFESKVNITRNTVTYVSQDLGASNLTSSGVIFSIKKMEKKPDVPQTGEIQVQTEPNGATVYLDNEEHGPATLVLSNINKGQHEITVSSPGFFPRSEKIDVINNFRIIAKFKLAIDPLHKKVDESIDSKLASESASINATPSPTGQASSKATILIKETGTGFLRVRFEPSLNASESARVIPGNKFPLIEEQTGWYKIEYEKGKTGWVSSQYCQKTTN